MNLEETIRLAETGDCKAICALGNYYMNGGENQKRDIDEALKWFHFGAKQNYPVCMHLSALAGNIKAHILRKIYGSPDYKQIIDILTVALSWAQKAVDFGTTSAKKTSEDIQGNLGIAYYFLSMESSDSKEFGPITLNNLKQAISLMKPLYQETNNKEVLLYLGFALLDYGMGNQATKEDERLAHSLLKKCVDNYFNELDTVAFAAVHLGYMYVDGRGCEKNYDAAVYYFQKAQNAGADCNDILSRFKKTIFGGYKFIK